jgi:hypothetical protein
MIDLFSLMLGVYAVAACMVFAGLVAFAWRWVNRRMKLREVRLAQPAPPAGGGLLATFSPEITELPSEQPRIVPCLGLPEQVEYHPEDYVEPLRCTLGFRCDDAFLSAGETFTKIPWVGDPQGRFLVICAQDIWRMNPAQEVPRG